MFSAGEQIPGGEKRKRREARKMKAVRLRVALTAALAFFLAATAGHQAQAGAGGIEAKFEYCTTCHGPSAQGFRGFYAMPRLAGQQPQYIENQLHAFLERRRLNPVMANVAHGITPDMIPALAAHMSALKSSAGWRRARGRRRFGERDLHEWIARSECSRLFRLPRPRREGAARNTSSRRPALLVHGQHPVDLEQRTRPGRASGHIMDHAANRGEFDPERGAGARRICQRAQVNHGVLLRQPG